MAGINKVILVGNLGKDPDIMTFENGVKRAAVSLATTESYKDKDGNWVEQTEWHNLVLWRWLAEKNLIKGDTVYVEGKIKTRSWDDKEGNKRYTTEIVAEKVIRLVSRKDTASAYGAPPPPTETPENFPEKPATQTNQQSGTTTSEPVAEAPSDDLPF